MYLGDGYINLANKQYNVYKLRITQDTKYPKLIDEYVNVLSLLFPTNKVGIYYHKSANACDVYVQNQDIIDLFPQHGPGRKHTRCISLADWQRNIVEQFPKEFIRGLMVTDGSRYVRTVGSKRYLSYNFTNTSKDIIDLLCWACNLVGVSYSVYERDSLHFTTKKPTGSKRYNVSFNKRSSVQILESFIGIKS